MLFSLKSPLKRSLNTNELHKSQEATHKDQPDDAFIGASLIDKSGCAVSLDTKQIHRISGNFDTYAPDLGIKMIGKAIEKNLSVLMLDFQIAEEYWHKFWAISFYYDRAKDFRLIDLANAERSDVLGPQLPERVIEQFADETKHLGATEKPFDLKQHLQNQGLVALSISGVSEDSASCDAFDPEKEKYKKLAWSLCQDWLTLPDVLVVFGWDELSLDRQKLLLETRLQQHGDLPRLIIVQNSYSFTPDDGEFPDTKILEEAYEFAPIYNEILFRQRNSLSERLYGQLNQKSSNHSLSKVTQNLNSSLDGLDDNQCIVLHENRVDLIQTHSGDGLPWPPDYKPLRARYPGN